MKKVIYSGLLILFLLSVSSCNKTSTLPTVEPTAFEISNFQVIPPKVTDKDYLAFDDTKINFGIYLNQPDDIRNTNMEPDIIGWYDSWESKATSKQKMDLIGIEHVAIPMITWMPVDISLEEIANGKYDEYIKGYIRRLAINCPENDILIRFAHEMEYRPTYQETWYSWQEDKDPELFIKAWRHVIDLGRTYNSNIKWIWSPNRSDEYSAAYYPGDDYVDYVGLTLNLPETDVQKYKTFGDFYVKEGTKEHIEKYNKKVIICEVAYSNKNQQEKQAYLKSIFDYAASDENIAAILFFNTDVSEIQQYRISDNEQYMNLINEEIKKIRNE